jgi:hypothetical protein
MPARPSAGDWLGSLDVDRVLRAQGADPAAIRRRSPRLVAIAERALREGIPLLEPFVRERRFAVERADRHALRLSGGGSLSGALPAGRFAAARELVVLVATVGGALEEAAAAAMRDDPAFGLALDGLGTAAVDALATSSCNRLAAEAGTRGWHSSPGLGPGLEGWPLERGQRELFTMLGKTQVRLGEGGMMTPRKSLTMVVGQGPEPLGDESACDLCDARTRCRHRIAS